MLQQSNMLDAEFYDFAVALSAKRVASIQRLSQNRLPKLTPPSRVGLSPGGKIRTRAQCSRAFSDWKVRQEQRRHQDQRFLQRRRQRIRVLLMPITIDNFKYWTVYVNLHVGQPKSGSGRSRRYGNSIQKDNRRSIQKDKKGPRFPAPYSAHAAGGGHDACISGGKSN